MNCGGGVSGGSVAPACFCVDGVRVPIPDKVGLVAPASGGFTFPAHEGHRVAAKAARQMDHYRRVRNQARRMPELAKAFGGEDVLVDLMYGDTDEFARFLQGAPIAPGIYAPN